MALMQDLIVNSLLYNSESVCICKRYPVKHLLIDVFSLRNRARGLGLGCPRPKLPPRARGPQASFGDGVKQSSAQISNPLYHERLGNTLTIFHKNEDPAFFHGQFFVMYRQFPHIFRLMCSQAISGSTEDLLVLIFMSYS